MAGYHPLFDTSSVNTPSGMNAVVGIGSISGIPAKGTGLTGGLYISNNYLSSVDQVRQMVNNYGPILNFTATEVHYRGTGWNSSVSDFLGSDAASISGANGSAIAMKSTGIELKGYVYIPAGVHEIAVASDDGFSLKIGGVDFIEYTGTRSTEETGRVAEFAGGLYEVEMLYFDAGGGQSLRMEIDGLTVDQSAFYQSVADFQNPPAGTPMVPTGIYHPSAFLGEQVLDNPETMTFGNGDDIVDLQGGNDVMDGAGGDDNLKGGYGDDKLLGGDGDDILQGGRGSDLLMGGDGNDILISRSDAGEQRIGQLAIGNPTRPDPDNEVNDSRQKLKGYEGQAFIGDDVMFGGAGADTFLISPQINAKLEIIQKHTRSDGTINWAGVAGENNELHDHWVDSFGIDVIGDYVAGEDKIAIIGHTARVTDISYRDVDGDGDDESIITVTSAQHGAGGAHDKDLLGQLIVHGDLVQSEDIKVDAGVTYGIVENYADVSEAIFPVGQTKVTTINGQAVYGYDTRTPGGQGDITGDPENHIDNPFLANPGANGIAFANPTAQGPELTRDHIDPLQMVAGSGETKTAGGGNDTLAPTQAAQGALPPALAYWRFTDNDGSFADERGGATAKSYTHYESQAILRTGDITVGPDGGNLYALEFNGKDEFVHIQHESKLNISQGTIALWVRPDDLSKQQTYVSKDQSGSGDGGHFRLGHTKNGDLLLRFAPGDGRWGNATWETKAPVLTEGNWSHLAVSFTENGVVVYVDGIAIQNSQWSKVEGNVSTPGAFKEAYLIQNDEPWVLGADTYISKDNDTAAEFAADRSKLVHAFDGGLAEFGIWGGFSADDALSQSEVQHILAHGPWDALSAPAQVNQIVDADDVFSGGGGNDVISGEGGDDALYGGSGADKIDGGYGNDSIEGGAGADSLDGGRGSDYVDGGAGNDILYSRSDGGEQRAGQLVLDAPSRAFPDDSIDPTYLKLVDWVDQPLVADDVLVGGEGNDTFYFEPLINGKLDIIMKHVNDDRTIDWMGVAGENNRIHDHWVDQFGIDVIADYDSSEDTIKVIGHTANILDVSYITQDTDGDGIDDDVISVITVYSQQGKGGGAHDEDLLGMIAVHGDMVHEDDIITNPKVAPGIVRTIDEIQEAVAPSGTNKIVTDAHGQQIYGYDTRDMAGSPIQTDPESYSDNTFLANGQVNLTNNLEGTTPPVHLFQLDGGSFDGTQAQEVMHTAEQARTTGSWTFSFSADAVGPKDQTLISKDHSGYKTGGHMTIWIGSDGNLRARFQSDSESRYLKWSGEKIKAGEAYDVAFTYDAKTVALYVNGVLVDTEKGFAAGMTGNSENLIIGASSESRWNDKDYLREYFDGTITDIAYFDRSLDPAEALLLSRENGNALAVTHAFAPVDYTPDVQAAATMSGDKKDNRLLGSQTDDVIDGREGDDFVIGGDGDDVLRGGDGVDFVQGGNGDDTLSGGDGADQLIGNAGSDTADYGMAKGAVGIRLDSNPGWGAANGDVLYDVENLTGSRYDDQLDGNGGSNIISGGLGHDNMSGMGGNDTMIGGAGNDLVKGGSGDDVYLFGKGDGQDRLEDSEGRNAIRLSDDFALDDLAITLNASGEIVAAFYGTSTGDQITFAGSTSASSILGFHSGISFGLSGLSNGLNADDSGNVVYGRDESDFHNGRAGNDTVLAFGGNDIALGGAGDDHIGGGTGGDMLFGGSGNDVYHYNRGDGMDRITDFSGFDTVKFDDPNLKLDDLIMMVNPGQDLVLGFYGSGGDVIELAQAVSNPSTRVELVEFSNGTKLDIGGIVGGQNYDDNANTIVGQSTSDFHNARGGNDAIMAMAGNDIVVGGAGDDAIDGGWGLDVLSGGTGSDKFVFTVTAGINDADLILDFERGSDMIGLSNHIYGLTGGVNASNFTLGSAASDANDRVIFDASTGELLFDADGNGSGQAERIAVLANTPTLSESDFFTY